MIKDVKNIKIVEIMNFGECIRKGREHLGISLEKAAQQLEISASYLSDHENGKVGSIKIDFIYLCANFYGLSVDELCTVAGKIPKDIYYKITAHPHIFEKIRKLKV